VSCHKQKVLAATKPTAPFPPRERAPLAIAPQPLDERFPVHEETGTECADFLARTGSNALHERNPFGQIVPASGNAAPRGGKSRNHRFADADPPTGFHKIQA